MTITGPLKLKRIPEAIMDLAKGYAPYHRYPAFWQGYIDGQGDLWRTDLKNVEAQAYDRGLELAARASALARAERCS